MKATSSRIVTSFILCLFVNFVFSNTVFMHTHVASDGRLVTHSHPYMPSAGHGHSAMQFDQIAGFNASAAAMEVSGIISVLPDLENVLFIDQDYSLDIVRGITAAYALRAPPAA